ncbi:alpha/beta hydrolase fold domain-containing protein [Pseudonocardia sp. C8]|uniref:alpha/beta hydrolase fold domain-containing protein n=1 Tax=Pseudonocardia sp. C8 TaxID=2762759 RepID=UPI0016434C13|nr:alpha/beta hydrolase fold domain-containing protein [Pseudonocardia sp. C8]MBC3192320.1 alpha/beta hydrolase fold domain-containing protein [Pseudonocardia sp. C8]
MTRADDEHVAAPTAPASLRARALVAAFRWRRTSDFFADPATMRAHLAEHQDPAHTRPPRWLRATTDVEHRTVDGHDAWTLRPRRGVRTGMHVLHLHGGGFVEQPARHHWRFARWLACRLGAAVTLPIYPLCPDHDHHDIWPVVRHCYEQFLAAHRPDDRVVLGDSCGGALALALAQLLRDRGEPVPSRIGLFSPWLDLAVSDPLSARIAPHDPVLGIEGLRLAGRWYAGNNPIDDPEISPVDADLRGLGRIAAFAGTRDLLLADTRRLRRDAEEAGQTVEMHEYPGMFHNWIMQPIPEAEVARGHLLDFLRR